MNRSFALAAGILFCLTSLSLAQQDNERITVQGRLTDTGGNPLDSTGVSMTFKIYRGGGLSWTHTQSVDVVDGIFDVAVGPGIEYVGFDRETDLGITLDGEGVEMTPRIALGASPFARALPGFYTYWARDLGTSNEAYNVVGGGGKFNFSDRQMVGAGVEGAVIAGGGGVAGAVPSPNSALADWATIGGGRNNTVNGLLGTIAGGVSGFAGLYGFVGGGTLNRALGSRATVPGGHSNQARGDYSFAAGYKARAIHEGSFVWNDRSVTTLKDSLVSTGVNQFLVRAAGGFGIGTASPKQGLTISRDVEAAAYQLELRNVGDIHGGYFSGIAFTQTSTGATENASIKVIYHSDGKPDMSFSVRDAADALFIKSVTGDIGVGTTSPTVALEVNGEIKAPTITETSDARMKRNVAPIHNALELVTGLQGVSFDWNREAWPHRVFEAGRQIGLIAQEVERVVPEVVHQDNDGYYSVAYSKLVPLLIEAIKEQQELIEAQNRSITGQNERIAALERRLVP